MPWTNIEVRRGFVCDLELGPAVVPGSNLQPTKKAAVCPAVEFVGGPRQPCLLKLEAQI